MAEIVIIVSWLVILIAAIVFIILFGPPWRYEDKGMAWHLSSMAIVGALETVALLLTRWSLIPAVFAFSFAAVVMVWRVTLLMSSRKMAKLRTMTKHKPDDVPE